MYSFLSFTKNKYAVYVPYKNNGLYNYLNSLNKHRIISFNNVKVLYLRIFVALLINRIKSIYCNEGGHIRYINFLATLFPKKSFYIHIRLIEDSTEKRLNSLSSNIFLISVSEYIANLIKENTGYKSEIISSPNRGSTKNDIWYNSLKYKKRIGIIGRITPSKGVEKIISLINYLEENKLDNLELYFFGDIEDKHERVKNLISVAQDCKYIKCYFHGYTKRELIYNKIDVVIHFNTTEPLGVIFFEALNACKPFIGFNYGGIGNIAQNIGIADLMLTSLENWIPQVLELLDSLNKNLFRYKQAKKEMHERYSIQNYTKMLESKILEK